MNRIETLRSYIDEILLNMKDTEERRCAYIHLYGVAQTCAMIAEKRNSNTELATMAGMLHDLYSYKTMVRDNHAHLGAELARKILKELNLISNEEIDLICSAIYNHSDKDKIHLELDEIIKDADVLQHCLYNTTLAVKGSEEYRYTNLMKEFGIR